MSLVGTRPILQDELQKYELHHRARIAIKPGITGMWQVSGRSDIDRNVNERTRLSLYADFLYPLASDSTLEDFYREKPEGEFCPELTAARTRVWEVLRPYRMKLLRLAPAKFIHFGTTREILELMNGGVDEYHYLGWSRKVGSSIRSDVSGYNSVLSSRASVGKDCYLEVSYVHGNSRIGSHSVLSYIDVQDQVIPDNVVLHGLKQRNGKFIVRIFGVNDNPKENRLFGKDLDELEDTLGVRFWEENGQAHTLWSAALYQEADTMPMYWQWSRSCLQEADGRIRSEVLRLVLNI